MMMRILGLLRIVFNTTKTYVILFQNSLPDPYITIEEKYDLKGRMPKPGKSVNEREPISTDALKDNEIARRFALDEKDLRHYWKILGDDVRFLRSQNVMDYSLLVGIHKVTNEDVKCHKALVKAGKSKEPPMIGRKNKKVKDQDKRYKRKRVNVVMMIILIWVVVHLIGEVYVEGIQKQGSGKFISLLLLIASLRIY